MDKCTLQANGVRVVFQEGEGSFSFSAPSFELKNCRPALKLDGKAVSLKSWRTTKCTATAIPYALWENRGKSEMLVWVRKIV